jgi:hypothetical protein
MIRDNVLYRSLPGSGTASGFGLFVRYGDLPASNFRIGDNPRINDSKALVDLQLILEKAGTPNQLLIATSSMMGGFWS